MEIRVEVQTAGRKSMIIGTEHRGASGWRSGQTDGGVGRQTEVRPDGRRSGKMEVWADRGVGGRRCGVADGGAGRWTEERADGRRSGRTKV